MTYLKLIEILTNKIPKEKLNKEVMIYHYELEKFFTINKIAICDSNDGPLDDGDVYLTKI